VCPASFLSGEEYRPKNTLTPYCACNVATDAVTSAATAVAAAAASAPSSGVRPAASTPSASMAARQKSDTLRASPANGADALSDASNSSKIALIRSRLRSRSAKKVFQALYSPGIGLFSFHVPLLYR